ncbi:MAG: hypothetical protein ACT4OS_03280 [Acidimicrobiales bacterium]
MIDAERSGVALDHGIDDDDDVAIAAITVAELRGGVLLASPGHAADRQAFLDGILDLIPVLDYDSPAAEAHAELLAHSAGKAGPEEPMIS